MITVCSFVQVFTECLVQASHCSLGICDTAMGLKWNKQKKPTCVHFKAVQQSSSKSWTVLTGSVPAVPCRRPSLAHSCKGEGAQNRKLPQKKHEHPTGPATQCGTFLHFSQDTYEVGQIIVRGQGCAHPPPAQQGWPQGTMPRSGGRKDAVRTDPWSGWATAHPLLP